jgi:hypothetical protein
MCKLTIVIILWVSFPVYASGNDGTTLYSYKWHNRVVIFNELAQDKQLVNTLEQHKTHIEQRDIIWFVIATETMFTNAANPFPVTAINNAIKQFNVSQGDMALIGKDGTLKFRTHHLNMDELFSVIDAMPMRQREMQHQRIQYDF